MIYSKAPGDMTVFYGCRQSPATFVVCRHIAMNMMKSLRANYTPDQVRSYDGFVLLIFKFGIGQATCVVVDHQAFRLGDVPRRTEATEEDANSWKIFV